MVLGMKKINKYGIKIPLKFGDRLIIYEPNDFMIDTFSIFAKRCIEKLLGREVARTACKVFRKSLEGVKR